MHVLYRKLVVMPQLVLTNYRYLTTVPSLLLLLCTRSTTFYNFELSCRQLVVLLLTFTLALQHKVGRVKACCSPVRSGFKRAVKAHLSWFFCYQIESSSHSQVLTPAENCHYYSTVYISLVASNRIKQYDQISINIYDNTKHHNYIHIHSTRYS